MPGESIVETAGSSVVMASDISHPMPGKSIVETSGPSAVMAIHQEKVAFKTSSVQRRKSKVLVTP